MVFNVLILYRTSLSSIQTEFLAGCKWVCKVVAKEIKGALGHQIQDSPLPRVHLVICHVTKHARCYRDHERSLTSKELVACLGRKLQKKSVHQSTIVFLFCFLAFRHAGILGPQPEIKPVPPALEVQSLTHWAARQVQIYH